ncbi:intermembrane lipid transfer protein VPS13D-like isoform X2 [Hydractinia symbiolongicarpus]|uniref:intermembrane lipid transfer protein VPS13D-like isoform X2 n=1 Tax=Hydractinia symbiolongicarpus TaxID=13093 RepID=UPI00254EE139|nr:intermembrane lipid transfer protein VPS13D-like isoform X2 [Hydractinia symbiolongicarpus]
MFQSIAVWLLQTYVGEYIENLNTNQLSIGYDGIELENLHLKKTAFNKVRLPVKLISGVIRRFHLVIPYRNPNTQPWIIKIEGLSIVAEPDTENSYERDEEKRQELIKERMLAELEMQWKASMQHPTSGGWWNQSWFSSFYSSFSSKIVENLLLEIKDVNILYQKTEHDTFGVKLGRLNVQSTDENWVESFGEENLEMKYKLLKLKDLTMYHDDKKNLKVPFEAKPKDVCCLLEPVHAEARVKRNANKVALSLEDGARFYIEVLLEDVALNISDKQYRKILEIVEDVNRYYHGMEYAKWKPKESIHNNPKSWWKFAFKCIVEPIKKRNERATRQFLIQRIKDVNKYTTLYKDYLINGNMKMDMKETIKDIEREWKYEEIVALRKFIYSKITTTTSAKKLVAEQSVGGTTWTEWALSFNPLSSSQAKENQNVDAPDLTVTNEERKFLEELSEHSEDGSLFNSDVMLARLNFALESGSLVLKSEARQHDILSLQFNKLNFISELCPKSKSWEWTMHLSSLVVKNSDENGSIFPNIFGPQTGVSSDGNTESKFLSIKLGQTEFTKATAYKLDVKLEPSSIVYNQSVLGNVREFFSNQEKSRFNQKLKNDKFQEAIKSQIEALKHATKAELANVLETLMKGCCQEEDEWSVELDIAAPQLIIPISVNEDVVAENIKKKMIIFNLGRMTFCNTLARKSNLIADPVDVEENDNDDEFITPSSTPPQNEVDEVNFDLPEEEIDKRLYDSYALDLSNVQILICNFGDNWITSQAKGFGPSHVVDQFSVCFILKRRIIFTADLEYPALTLSGVLPLLLVHIDENKLQALFNCMSMFAYDDGKLPSDSDEKMSMYVNQDFSRKRDKTDMFLANDIQDLLLESKLLLAKFTFEKLSLGLHSRGRCFSELQVEGVECELTKRPYDISVSFILSSLRLIDAVQTFGADYELLVSSKPPGIAEKDVLIHICYQKINADCPSLGNAECFPVQILVVHFNTLYINGNLETLVELSNVLRQLKPKGKFVKQQKSLDTTNKMIETPKELQNSKIDISASFKKIDILLLRKIICAANLPQNVAMVSLGQLELEASVGKEQLISGSIGNISVTDVSPNQLAYKSILSVGNLDNVFQPQSFVDPIKAFTFQLSYSPAKDKENLSIHMASAYYIHNPHFLKEIVLYAGDYKQYALNLARSLQNTATDMAKSMVSAKKDTGTDVLPSTEIFHNSPVHKGSMKDNNRFLFDCFIESPVVVFPKDEKAKDLIVAHLGKISIKNMFILDSSSKCDQIDRLIIEIEKMNLLVVNLNSTEISGSLTHQNQINDILKMGQRIAILDNTDIHLQIDKLQNERLQLEVFFNKAVKIFLSVDIYRKILGVVDFASKTSEESNLVPMTPKHSCSMDQEIWERPENDIATKAVQSLKIVAELQIPMLELALHGELNGVSHGFVVILFEDFRLRYGKIEPSRTTYNISLQDFLIKDLLHKRNDQYKFLISSLKKKSKELFSTDRPCSSCPEHEDFTSTEVLSKSLPVLSQSYQPNNLITEKSRLHRNGSPAKQQLVSVEVTLDTSESENQEARKKIDVTVSTIDVVINLQTWVILLEFLGVGTQKPNLSPSMVSANNMTKSFDVSDLHPSESVETDISLVVQNITFYLNKESYPLAKACLSELHLNVTLDGENQDVGGSIGFIELMDISPYCGNYTKRLVTLGTKAFNFSFYRFGPADPELLRQYDMDLTLSLSVIQYVHSQRFLSEIIAFGQHFIFLQEVLGRMRAAGAGDEVLATVNRAARLSLKVNADAPILLLPRNSNSKDLLIANLGKLSINNQFLLADDPNTNALKFNASRSRNNEITDSCEGSVRLLDCINIQLSDMRVFSALAVTEALNEMSYIEQGDEMMTKTCTLDLRIERNLEWAFGRQVPDISISGSLSSVNLALDLSQHSLIMGMLGENLGEQVDAFTAPSSVLVDPLVMPSPSKRVWTTLHLKLHLSNVSIETSPCFSFGDIPSYTKPPCSLARFDFLKSNFIYESFSDGSKSIDLVSTDVLLHDTRQNVNLGVLVPSKRGGHKNFLQFEVHYLDTKEKSLLTFLCNQSRIILKFDFLLKVFHFITRKEENDYRAVCNFGKPETGKDKECVQQDVSPGVLIKTSVSETESQPSKRFEMKVNVTESELVVAENIEDADTSTVVLKTTAVFAYRPDALSQKLITCSFENLEVFSCQLSQPEESALSIVDPVSFLIELNSHRAFKRCVTGFYRAVKKKTTLEVQLQAPVNIRVSYHDVEIFRRILNSARSQIQNALQGESQSAGVDNDIKLNKPAESTVRSSFNEKDITTVQLNKKQSDSTLCVEVKANSISVTLIDDAGNNDVPLLDVLINNMLLRHDEEFNGVAKCQLDVSYYNTRVSAWEPFMEEWKFNVHWSKHKNNNNLVFKIDASERLEMNVTSALVDISKRTAALWSSRFFNNELFKEEKRAPFLPFLLRNKTGCKLAFHTLAKSLTKISKMTTSKQKSDTTVRKHEFELKTGEEVAFSFEARTKQRHQASHDLLVRQIVVQIAGSFPIKPLTVDRVGKFFRIVSPLSGSRELEGMNVLFDVTLEGARKVVTVTSALSVRNNLSFPIDLVGVLNEKTFNLSTIQVNETYFVPLPMILSTLYCRPLKAKASYCFCKKDLNWRDVARHETRGINLLSSTDGEKSDVLRFSSLIKSIDLPRDTLMTNHSINQPEHSISLVHTVLLQNLLPFDLFYLIQGRTIKEMVKPAENVPLHCDTPNSSFEIGFSFENFPGYDTIRIFNDGSNYILPSRVYDINHRLLILNTMVACNCGTLQVSVFAPYWIINKTGLPVVFKREDDPEEIAGQFEEHEEARSLTPLPFSYLSSEHSFHCQMRVGRHFQGNQGMVPLLSKPFSLEKEMQNRTLYVRERKGRLERNYDVAIITNWGKGAFSKTRVVVIVPRYQIDNQYYRPIVVAQRQMVQDTEANNPASFLLCDPNTVSNFHWSHCGYDQILCVRLNDSATLWSGGFRLDCETTYHLNLRSTGKAEDVFIRVHITFHAGTFCCTLSDAACFPPPFRIVNLSDVKIFYWQDNIPGTQMRNCIKPKERKNYVLDQPLLPAKLNVSVFQESTQCYDLKKNGQLSKLYYHNAIYITFLHTFYGFSCGKHSGSANTDHQLVFDVVDDRHVVLARKCEHKISQLWRMNADGNLVHFCTTSYKNPRKTSGAVFPDRK